jgi:hypothetical protein
MRLPKVTASQNKHSQEYSPRNSLQWREPTDREEGHNKWIGIGSSAGGEKVIIPEPQPRFGIAPPLC